MVQRGPRSIRRSDPRGPTIVRALVFVFLAGISAPARGQGAAPVELERIQSQFESLARDLSPSVVGIRAQRRLYAPRPGESPDRASVSEQLVLVNGSGTVIRADGSILTNEHVVQAARSLEVLTHDGRALKAVVVAADARSDLAVLRVAGLNLPPARWGDWTTVARGQWNVVLGNPFGLGNDGQLSVSVGVISNLGRRLPGLGEADDRFYTDMIQTTATISPGNSGGPLFNLRGELIGVVTAMHTRSLADEGVGFAIPMSPAKRRIIEQLLDGRAIEYGSLGLTARTLDPQERAAAAAPAGVGVAVQSVDPDGPAARAGIAEGDVVLRFGGEAVSSPAQFVELVGSAVVGSQVEIELRRGGRELRLSVHVERRKTNRIGLLRGAARLGREPTVHLARQHQRSDAEDRRVLETAAAPVDPL